MARTSNDDRSDTMNPNNDAYSADQANRYGDDDGSSSDPGDRAQQLGPCTFDTRFGPDPHPMLGKRSNRLPSLSRNFEHPGSRHIRDVIPWTEVLALAFATPESEARDRSLAAAELMNVARWILREAHAVIVRQGMSATLDESADGPEPSVTLTVGTRSVLVRASGEFDVVFVDETDTAADRLWTRAFGFSRLRWHGAKREERGIPRHLEKWQRTPDEEAEYQEAFRHRSEPVYRRDRNVRPTDPAKEIFDSVQTLARR